MLELEVLVAVPPQQRLWRLASTAESELSQERESSRRDRRAGLEPAPQSLPPHLPAFPLGF